MTDDLAGAYRAYIDCLNRRDWAGLGEHVAAEVEHNGRRFGLSGYRGMLEADVQAIPDLRFNIDMLMTDGPMVAARLLFDCHPVAELFGLAVDGRRVRFAENVFYEFREGRIARVWSVIDKAAIAEQL
ncbi:ester cyclase [Marinibacterium sp. SX1]|uniref:ester cyclase n=1 Tax=Marinibacterium sp. SX1 TaxID=3388424 RepID=UPI003D1684AA